MKRFVEAFRSFLEIHRNKYLFKINSIHLFDNHIAEAFFHTNKDMNDSFISNVNTNFTKIAHRLTLINHESRRNDEKQKKARCVACDDSKNNEQSCYQI